MPNMRQAELLQAAWRSALQELDGSSSKDYAEQQAYDALIEHLEANGLNYSQYDPRRDDA